MRNLLLNKKTWDNLDELAKADPNLIDEDEDYNVEQNYKAPLTALKGHLGHSQLCAGAVESVFTIKAMKENIMPQIRNLENPCLDDIKFVMGEN